MRWIVDTSAWSRRDTAEVKQQLRSILEEEDSEFVLSPSVLLELLRGPQGEELGTERDRLTSSMETLIADGTTFELAADAMVSLAGASGEAHRLPVPDLITAALAHQHDCGIVHLDDDFELLAKHSGLVFQQRRIELRDGASGGEGHSAAGGQRALKRELAQLLHQKPVAEAEDFLHRVLSELRGG